MLLLQAIFSSVYHLGDCGSLVKRPLAVVSKGSDHSRIAALTFIDTVILEAERHKFA